MIAWTRIPRSRAIRAVGVESSGGGLDGGGGSGRTRIHVQFKRGKTYVYDVGSRSYFDRFIGAPSKGRFYVFVIKQRFDYVMKY